MKAASKIALALVLGAMVAACDGAPGQSVTFTAEDTANGERPVLDLTSPLGWIIDGTHGQVDWKAIDVKTSEIVLPLDVFLARNSNLSNQQMASFTGRRVEIWPLAFSADPVLRRTARVPCTDNICCDGCNQGTGVCCIWHPGPNPISR